MSVMASRLIALVAVQVSAVQVLAETQGNAEHQLYRHIFTERKYNKVGRPVRNVSDVLQVALTMRLLQLLDVNEKEQTWSVACRFTLEWKDEWLAWNESDFQGVRSLRVKLSDLWEPNLELANDLKNPSLIQTPDSVYAVILSDGQVGFSVRRTVCSYCRLDLRTFPFDTQLCELVVQCVTHSVTEVDFINVTADQFSGTEHQSSQFELKVMPVQRKLTDTPVHQGQGRQIVGVYTLKRNPRFDVINILVPFSATLALVLAQFLLPASSGEKVSYITTVVLALSVLQLGLVNNIPEESQTLPVINEVFLGYVCMASVAVIMAIISVWAHHHSKITDGQGQGSRSLFMRLCSFCTGSSGKVNSTDHVTELEQPRPKTGGWVGGMKGLTCFRSFSGFVNFVSFCCLLFSALVYGIYSFYRFNEAAREIAEHQEEHISEADHG